MFDLHFLDRRFLVVGAATCLLGWTASSYAEKTKSETVKRISRDGVEFSWKFQTGVFLGEFCAPTKGWLAVGFNSAPGLKDSYFVMMRLSDGVFQVSERISILNGHVGVDELDLPSVLIQGSGHFENGRTSVSIALPRLLPGPAGVELAEGRHTHIMLAWSQDKDFTHHSAWRRHFQSTL
jgi:hypothetical protein